MELSMKEKVDEIRRQFSQDVTRASDLKALEAMRITYLGKKGVIQEEMLKLRGVAPELKPQYGKLINDLKTEIENGLELKFQEFYLLQDREKIAKEGIDITLPGRKKYVASAHPVTQILDEIIDIFTSMGFSVETTPEMETDWYNFEVLNFQPDHPARDMQDTFYIDPHVLLRTHCTTFQGRIMESVKPPIRVINPGKCFRNETVSSRSHVFFHQVDGLYVAEDVTMQDLIATMTEFIQKLFKKEVSVRIRPSYFPFVEPGIEADVACLLCQGKGCALCKYSGWLEIVGAGMVHPQVFRNCGLDPEKYTGFAFGFGVERPFLLRHHVNDIRLFWENDMRFLSQFPG
jgi:phenylalanyl-tRNA synthetase alpha chain